MAKALALSAGLLAASLSGCSPFGGGAFTCSTDEQCQGGQCEQATSSCSFPNLQCPSGRSYGEHSGPLSGVCVGQEPTDGGPSDTPADIAIDAPFCVGDPAGLVQPCFPSAPSGTVALPATINTDTSTLCATDVTGADGLCVIAGGNIDIGVSVDVTGGRPLVLVAVTQIAIAGVLDAASHRGLTTPYTTVKTGPGANPASCGTPTTPGNNSGGAGGTLGGRGGTGGNAGGTAPQPVAITEFRGGCRGQNGTNGSFGTGGAGGGAVYLIADSIQISGAINASGEGARPGFSGNAGAGGGGSGGMIVLDAPTIGNTSGSVYANGASGGEGSGTNNPGAAGPEPTSVAASPPPPGINAGGGDGGGGSAGAANAAGGNGENGGGGGGGGGGVGVIKVFRGTLQGARSPTPS